MMLLNCQIHRLLLFRTFLSIQKRFFDFVNCFFLKWMKLFVSQSCTYFRCIEKLSSNKTIIVDHSQIYDRRLSFSIHFYTCIYVFEPVFFFRFSFAYSISFHFFFWLHIQVTSCIWYIDLILSFSTWNCTRIIFFFSFKQKSKWNKDTFSLSLWLVDMNFYRLFWNLTVAVYLPQSFKLKHCLSIKNFVWNKQNYVPKKRARHIKCNGNKNIKVSVIVQTECARIITINSIVKRRWKSTFMFIMW